MKELIILIIAILINFCVVGDVRADICYPQRIVNQWTCQGDTVLTTLRTCGSSHTETCNFLSSCSSECTGYPYVCVPCSDTSWYEGEGSCLVNGTTIVDCTSAANGCKWDGTRDNCRTEAASCEITHPTVQLYCWGPGDETHKACSDGSCVSVSGGGADECSTNDECGGGGGDTHLECVGLSCQTVGGAGGDLCSSAADCVPSYDISGGVYLDDTGSRDKSSPVANAGTVSITGQPLGAVGGDGLYSIAGVPDGETYAAVLSGLDPLYTCDDPGSCQLSVLVDGGNVENADFFVTTEREAWWQSVGGDVGSNLSNVVSNIPNSCIEPICYPYLSRGSTDNSGVLTYLLGTNSFGGGGSASEGEDYVAQASIPTARGYEGYDYFYRQFEMGINPVDDFALGKTGVSKPDPFLSPPSNGRAYYSNGSLNLNGASWSVDPGDSMVVFVDGDLDIDTQITTGGFLAFIVSGDITFSNGTVNPASETPLVEGVFIADGSIIVSSGSEKFIGEGIFIGWGGVVLSRDFGGLDNNTNPTELFIYRPDFVTNAPDAMRRPVMRWNEVAP